MDALLPEPDELEPFRRVVEQIYMLMQNAGVFGARHPTTIASAERLCAVLREAQPPYALQFVRDVVFRDRMLLPTEHELFERGIELGRAFDNLGAQELCVDDVPTTEGAIAFGLALSRGAIAHSDALQTARVAGLRFRELAKAQFGEESEETDLHVFAAAQVALAIQDAHEVAAKAPSEWPWMLAIATVRRLERAVDLDVASTMRAVDFAPGVVTPARRAVAACALVLAVLSKLEVGYFLRRCAAHAVFAVCALGLRERDGIALQPAALAALTSLMVAPVRAQSGMDPHRLRVCAIVRLLGRPADAPEVEPAAGVFGMIELAYQLERWRCPIGVGFDLTRVDLLARAVAEQDKTVPGRWVRAMIATLGLVPLGAYVLADGKLGVVMEQSEHGDAWRPKVLIGGQLITPVAPVQLYSPLAMTPWSGWSAAGAPVR